jgi:hypothetical protein
VALAADPDGGLLGLLALQPASAAGLRPGVALEALLFGGRLDEFFLDLGDGQDGLTAGALDLFSGQFVAQFERGAAAIASQ